MEENKDLMLLFEVVDSHPQVRKKRGACQATPTESSKQPSREYVPFNCNRPYKSCVGKNANISWFYNIGRDNEVKL